MNAMKHPLCNRSQPLGNRLLAAAMIYPEIGDLLRQAASVVISDGAAAPAPRSVPFAIGQLRHLYAQMLGGHVTDTGQAARGLLGPAIEILERAHDAPT
jgi:hypothetical protein